MTGCLAFMYVCVLNLCLVPSKARKGFYTSWNGVMDGCEPPHGRWVLNLSLREEQPMLLATDPSL